MNRFDISQPLGFRLKAMHRFSVAGLCSLFLFASEASAQRYTLRKPPELKNEFSVGMSMLGAADVSISNLGNVNGSFFSDGTFDDAFVGEDSTAGTDVADGKSYYFAFEGLEQITDADGNMAYDGDYIRANSTRGIVADGGFSIGDETGNCLGLEVSYVRYLTSERKLGFFFGMGNTGFDMAQSSTWDVELITRSVLYKGENLTGLDGYSGRYVRPRIWGVGATPVFVFPDEYIDLGESNVYGSTEATGSWKLKASYTNFRVGAVYNMGLTRRFNVRASGGFVATVASSSFRWTQSMTVPYETGDIDISDSGTSLKKKMLFGGWADLGAHYRINRNVTAFSSVQFQSTTSFEHEGESGYKIEFDSSSQIYAKTGFTWAF